MSNLNAYKYLRTPKHVEPVKSGRVWIYEDAKGIAICSDLHSSRDELIHIPWRLVTAMAQHHKNATNHTADR